jgi:hypothetical protein
MPRKPHSPETRAKIGAAQRGKKRKPHSLETRAKMSIARRGKPKSLEHRAKIGASQIGKHNAYRFNNIYDVQEFLRNNSIWVPFSGCWIWTSYWTSKGYAQCSTPILNEFRLHRAAYRAFKGEIPEGLSVLHRCDTPPCINPDHLWLGTHRDNIQDCRRKGRGADITGEKHPLFGRTLTPETRARMRAARLGRKHSPETRAKIGAAQRGKPRE